MIGAATIHDIEVWLVALAITVAVLTGFGIFARWCSLSPAVRQEKLGQLRVGMTPDEVKAILGAPRQMYSNKEGLRSWVFGSAMKRHVLVLEFNQHGRLESFAHGVPHVKHSGPPPNV
jgi:outer membrane protein assembly factor BamE (lipoprotein component of BamABCDE complex)